jgi:murein L,D-transpeptidase YafK
MKRIFRLFMMVIFLAIFAGIIAQQFPQLIARILTQEPPSDVAEKLEFQSQLAARDFAMGQPVFMRIFKEEAELEVWMKNGDQFALFKTYPICNFSGDLGPKLREGDRQSPEGFYFVGKSALNPNSSYHLSFNLGYPNAYDRAKDRTGSYLMVHGDCRSIGCYAMTDAGIEEIYGLGEAALNAGQPFFRVHAFPFRMTDARMARAVSDRWYPFWQNLKQGYDAFEEGYVPPNVSHENERYVFAPSPT